MFTICNSTLLTVSIFFFLSCVGDVLCLTHNIGHFYFVISYIYGKWKALLFTWESLSTDSLVTLT